MKYIISFICWISLSEPIEQTFIGIKIKKNNFQFKRILESDDSVGDKVSVVIDIVQTKKDICNEETFYGIYSQSLPSECFSSDGKRLIFSTQQQNEIRSYVVDIGKHFFLINTIFVPRS